MSGKSRHRTPPEDTRFRKGQSGNPRGRPKRAKASKESGSAFDVIIDRTITVTQGGVERELTVDEALQLQTYKAAIAGSRPAQRTLLKMIAKREAWFAKHHAPTQNRSVEVLMEQDPDNADDAMLLLGIACRNPERQDLGAAREQLLLEPWGVQAALSRRRGGSQLEETQVDDIRRRTSDAQSLTWPRGTGR